MKLSIIVPVYNGEETISECLNSIYSLDYPKQDYEIVIVNDGSTDNTLSLINEMKSIHKEVKTRLINFSNNKGRSLARFVGACQSKNDSLVFIDSRCMVDKKALKDVKELSKNYDVIVGNAYIEYDRSHFDRVFHLIHNQLYKPHFGKEFEDLVITIDNFDKSPKGTGVLFCKKQVFINNQLEDLENKDVSDDTKLLKNIITCTKTMLKTSKFKVVYLTRTDLKSNVYHLYMRGAKFIDYYFRKGKLYNSHIWFMIVATLFGLVSLWLFPAMFLIYTIIGLILLVIASISLSENLKDIFTCIILLPLFIGVFYLGLWRGLIKKVVR